MRRDRLRTAPIGDNLSYSKYINMVFEEPLILHDFAQKNQFYHWIEHLGSFEKYLTGNNPSYSMNTNFNEVKSLIIDGLTKSSFERQSQEIEKASNEEELNNTIIKQYTEDTNLYLEVNQNLRNCHLFQDETIEESDLSLYHFDLAPWILQLNTAIRHQPHYEKVAYRGTNLKKEQLKLYKEKEMFVWAPFVSASKSKEECFDGNVIFEIFTESTMSLNDKRFPRDISKLSSHPEEKEVIFPIACAYRVHYVKKENGIDVIGVATVDYN